MYQVSGGFSSFADPPSRKASEDRPSRSSRDSLSPNGPAGEKRLNSSNAAAWVPGQVMLPDTKHTPTMLAQRPCDKTIPGGVGGEFLFPERPIVHRQVGVFGASMPETAINENNDTLPAKGEIRFSKMHLAATPAGDAMRPKEAFQSARRSIAWD